MLATRSFFTIRKTILKNLRCVHQDSNYKTIYALSSGQGKCGVAVVRVSGPCTLNALSLMTNFNNSPKPRYAFLKNIKYPYNKEVIDKGLVLWFPAPKSFTGEDCCEFHVHGGVAVVSAILNALSSIPNFRLAKAGEFTRRAFYNGKLDLTEVEGLSDLLQAETEVQRKQAFLQTRGALREVYQRWQSTLVKNVAHIEAHIDFDETETLDSNILNNVSSSVKDLHLEITEHLNDGRKGERLRNGVRTIILGEPNVGKSSLFNSLSQRPASIVTPIEGTTRDILELSLDVGGYPLLLIDTAGLRHKANDPIEKEGISRAFRACQESDLILLVVDVYKQSENLKKFLSLSDFLKFYTKRIALEHLINNDSSSLSTLFNKHCIVIFNKIDLIDQITVSRYLGENAICISCKTEYGFECLVDKLTEKLKILCGEPKEHPSINQFRHRQCLIECLRNLSDYLQQVSATSCDLVLATENLRKSLRNLEKLSGKVTTEHLLDIIFKDFCVGK